MLDQDGVRAALEEAGRQPVRAAEAAPGGAGGGGLFTATAPAATAPAASAPAVVAPAATSWARTADGWALNLDGSDASTAFSLPRLEVHPSVRGWRSLCLLLDGTRHERLGRPDDSVHVARADAESAWHRLG